MNMGLGESVVLAYRMTDGTMEPDSKEINPS